MKRIVYIFVWFAVVQAISLSLGLFRSSDAQPRYFRNRLHPDGNMPITYSITLPNPEEPFVFNVCTQTWDEKIPLLQNIDDIVKNFTEAYWFDGTLRLLDRIYPVGRFIMEDVGAVKTSTWLSIRSSIHDIMRELPLALHEDTHEYLDNHSREFISYAYPIFPNFVLRIPYDNWPPRRIVEKYIPQDMKEVLEYLRSQK